MDDEKIGYGRPPKHSRFKPGQSGNRSGRPKRAKTIPETIANLLQKVTTVSENGVIKEMSYLDIMCTQIIKRAASGDFKVFKWIAEQQQDVDSYVQPAQIVITTYDARRSKRGEEETKDPSAC